jgi:predicted transcriptional regulator
VGINQTAFRAAFLSATLLDAQNKLENYTRRQSSTESSVSFMSDQPSHARALELTAQIVSAHVGNNATQADALPALIEAVFRTLTGTSEVTAEAEALVPFVPVKKSVFPDYIICLEDGKKLKMLKRHLATSYSMTPEQYRARWGLSADYPMVAPNYAAHRSELAKSIGLGRKPKEQPVEKPVKAKRKAKASV